MKRRHPGPVRTVFYSVIIVCAAVLIYLFACRDMRFFKVSSLSMEPTLRKGDYLLTLAREQYARGEIIVFEGPPQQNYDTMVKRIAGVQGDRVAVARGKLFLNGDPVEEPYIPEPIVYQMPPTEVPRDHLFVLGDNRNRSDDSSLWEGHRFIHVDDVFGRAELIYLPFNRIGPIRPDTAVFPDAN